MIVIVSVARLVGVEEFGKFGYALAVGQLFFIFTDFGTSVIMMKELGEAGDQGRERWVDYLSLKMVFFLVCAVLFAIASPFFWKWERPWILWLALFSMFGNSVYEFIQFLCNGIGRLDIARRQMVLHRSTFFAFSIGVLFISRRIDIVAAGLALGAVLGAVISLTDIRAQLKVPALFRVDVQKWKQILVESIPNGVGTALGMSYIRLGVIFLGFYVGEKQIGEYNAAFRVFELAYVFASAMVTVNVSTMAASRKEGKEHFKRETLGLIGIVGLSGMLFSVLIGLLAGPIINVLFGTSFEGSVAVLRVFGWVSLFVFMNYYGNHLMVVTHRQRRLAGHLALTFMGSLLSYVFLIPHYGAKGVALSLLVTEIILFTLNFTYIALKYRKSFHG